MALALAGCGLFGGSDPAPSPTTTSSTTSTTAAPVATSSPPELLDPGAEPRQALRVAYTEGETAQITFTSDLEVTQESEGRTQRLDSPPIAQVLSYEVGAVTADGAELTVRIEAVAVKGKGTGLSDEEIASLDADLAPLVGLEATATATPLGELVGLAFEPPADLPEELATQLATLEDQLTALGPALPAEEVGVGASWRTTSTAATGGAEVETVTTYTATAIADGQLQYRAEIRSSADAQPIDLAGLPEGTTAELTGSELTGRSTGTLGLDRLLIVLRTDLAGTQDIVLDDGTATTALRQALELTYVAATEPN